MDLYKYDHFFAELERKLKSETENRRKIIRKAIRDSHCPYLKEKLEILYRLYQ